MIGKHTQGPWRIGAMESGQVAVDGANGEEVTGFVSAEDGRLIAAAPDLLEACRMLLSLIRRNAPELSGKVCGYADAAIAKATGDE